MADKERMLLLSEQGVKHAEIARLCGVSRQYVHMVCGKYSPMHFTTIGEQCVFPNLRKWMNENKVNKAELLRRMGLERNPDNYDRLSRVMSGKGEPRRAYIDKMLRATGMTYETLFYTEASDGK